MAQLTGTQRGAYVQAMFARIAHRYDLINRLMTFGQDQAWRKRAIALTELPPGGRLLDLGTGTGDIALTALGAVPGLRQVVGGDFTLEMMRVGRRRNQGQHIRWSATDALNLPFPDATFDAITSGYLMRNVGDLDRAWSEQLRILKPGGRVVCLDTTPPPQNLLTPFIRFHLQTVIPTLGRLIAGASEAYTYLPDSTVRFLTAEALAERMQRAGFEAIRFERHMFGTMAIHRGQRPG
jgi:demethylmenaquinone methyltransferase/2-methoxy-6-polyprenyl-1,4-benzoquinol methylase